MLRDFIFTYVSYAICILHICVLRKPSIWPRNSYMRLVKTDRTERLIYVSHVNASLWATNLYTRSEKTTDRTKRLICVSFYLSYGESVHVHMSRIWHLGVLWTKIASKEKCALAILNDYRGSSTAPRNGWLRTVSFVKS